MSEDTLDQMCGWSSCPVPLQSTIYVSATDPLNAPAFEPSPMKPLPKWMSLLPSNSPERMPWEIRPKSVLDEMFGSLETQPTGITSLAHAVFCPTLNGKRRRNPASEAGPAAPAIKKDTHILSPIPSHKSEEALLQLRDTMTSPQPYWNKRQAPLISSEPLIRPSSRSQLRKESNMTTETYDTALEQQPSVPQFGTRLPSPPRLDQILAKVEPVPPGYLKPGAQVVSARPSKVRRVSRSVNLRTSDRSDETLYAEYPTTAAAAAAAPRPSSIKPSYREASSSSPVSTVIRRRNTPPSESSEFLRRYQVSRGQTVVAPSTMSSSPQTPVPRMMHSTMTTTTTRRPADPIIAKMRQISKGDPSQGKVVRATVSAEGLSSRLHHEPGHKGSEPRERDQDGRRQAVQDELKRVFGSGR